MSRDRIRGFYAILDENNERLARSLFEASEIVQVRVKGSGPKRAQTARMAIRFAREMRRLLIVNDDLDMALKLQASGVHLGQSDLPVEEARSRAPKGFLIGLSTHNLEQVRDAVSRDVDYIGYGPVFPTTTKTEAEPVQGIDALQAAVAAAGDVPVVAIGGITPERAVDVAKTGVAAACALRAVNKATDLAAAAAQINAAFER